MKLLILSLAALVFGRPAGLTTANAVKGDIDALRAEFDALKAQNEALQKQLAEKNATPAETEDTSALALLAKGAGVELIDVRWRVQAGLDPEQAVQAAVTQKNSDARKAAAQTEAK